MLKIGEVIYYDNDKYVVVGMVSREYDYSMSYDRDYRLVQLDKMKESIGDISEITYKTMGIVLTITGINFPNFKKVEEEAPFEISMRTVYNIRQKQKVLRNIVEYE